MPLDDATIGNLINGDENRRAIEAARALIHSRPCILFAGAGTSKPAGYPLWWELLTELQAVLNDQGVDIPAIAPTDLLAAADQLYACFADNHLVDTHYYSFLCNHFGPMEGQSLELQQILLTLPFCGIVTTNWDVCFEDAIHKARPRRPEFSPMFSIHEDHPNDVRRFFDSLWRGPEANAVAHLHGVYSDARKIILTATQYALAYGGTHEELTLIQPPKRPGVWAVVRKAVGALIAKTHSGSHNESRLFEPTRRSSAWTLLRRTVWALMATQRLIFVGFGMNDPFLYALFSYVSGDLWDTTGQIHYFVTGVSKDTNKDPNIDRRRLRTNLGIQSIFYEVQGNDHSRLVDVLYELGATPDGGRRDHPPVSDLLGPP